MQIIIGIIIGIVVATIGVNGIVHIADKGVEAVKAQSKEIVK
jgi:hypothetical protein